MAVFYNDTFTDSGGVNNKIELTAHTSDSGHSYVRASNDTEVDTVLDKLVANTGGNTRQFWRAVVTPPSADYKVHMDVTVEALVDFTLCGPGARITGTADTPSTWDGYFVVIDPDLDQLQILRYDDGVESAPLGTPYTIGLGTPPQTHKVTIEVSGNNIKAYLDDIERISTSDATYAAAGNPGGVIRVNTSYGHFSADNASAETLTAGSLGITSVNSGAAITDGQTGITISGDALDTVTSATIRDTSLAYSQDVTASYLASSAIAATVNHVKGPTPLTSASWALELVLSDGTTTATHPITVNPASGKQVVELAGTLILTDPESAFAPYTGPDPVVGDQYIVPTATVETAPITANADTTLEYDYSAISPVPETDSHSVDWWSSDGVSRVWSSGTINVNTPDTVGPVTVTVNVPVAATYAIGGNLDFTVNMDEASTVTGTPRVPLTIGGQARNAAYISGSGTAALVFRYTVQEGDEDTDGIAVGASIDLNGGTIVDASSNAATLALNGVENTAGVLVDGIRPIVSVNNLTTTDTSPTLTGSAGDATSLTLTVTGIGTYNPVPSGGTFDQTLPESALGTYPMTLDGTDAAGNTAVQASGTLVITNIITALKDRNRCGHLGMGVGI